MYAISRPTRTTRSTVDHLRLNGSLANTFQVQVELGVIVYFSLSSIHKMMSGKTLLFSGRGYDGSTPAGVNFLAYQRELSKKTYTNQLSKAKAYNISKIHFPVELLKTIDVAFPLFLVFCDASGCRFAFPAPPRLLNAVSVCICAGSVFFRVVCAFNSSRFSGFALTSSFFHPWNSCSRAGRLRRGGQSTEMPMNGTFLQPQEKC